MRAEALLRGGESVNEATALVNTIREGGYGSGGRNYVAVTLKEVQSERRLELAWEVYSRQDDIRFGCFIAETWPQSSCEHRAGDHLELLPVSQDAR